MSGLADINHRETRTMFAVLLLAFGLQTNPQKRGVYRLLP